jgi:hypothetical protein
MTTTTYTWRIAQLERETADGYVYTAHYTVDATDDTYRAGAYGSIGLERPEGELIPFADLTEELVIGWVQAKLGGEEKVTEIHAALQAQLDEQRAPSKAQGLPWGNEQVQAPSQGGTFIADDPATPDVNEA